MRNPIINTWSCDCRKISISRKETRGAFYKQFFYCYQNSIEISFCSHARCGAVITREFGTWYNSCTVVPCAKFPSDIILNNEVIPKPISHQIWINIENHLWKGSQQLHSMKRWTSYQKHPCTKDRSFDAVRLKIVNSILDIWLGSTYLPTTFSY